MIALLGSGQRDVFDKYMAEAGSGPATAWTFAFRARPHGITDPHDLFPPCASTTCAMSSDRSGRRC